MIKSCQVMLTCIPSPTTLLAFPDRQWFKFSYCQLLQAAHRSDACFASHCTWRSDSQSLAAHPILNRATMGHSFEKPFNHNTSYIHESGTRSTHTHKLYLAKVNKHLYQLLRAFTHPQRRYKTEKKKDTSPIHFEALGLMNPSGKGLDELFRRDVPVASQRIGRLSVFSCFLNGPLCPNDWLHRHGGTISC